MCRSGGGDSGVSDFIINSNGTVVFTGADNTFFTTTQVLRDFSAWYHLVLSVDTTAATAGNRIRFYLNGSQVTAFNNSYSPTQNFELAINQAAEHRIGGRPTFSTFFNGYLADIHFIDGQALTPSSFTEVSATTGRLEPKAYSGPTPTGNSFWLPFSDNSAVTATTLGKDNFNLGNNWTPNNLSVTAGAGNDSLVDTPTSYGTDTGAGGEVRGNYATLNPLKYGGDIQAPTNGNLDVTSVGSATGKILGTIGVSSGKWYWECVPNSSANIAFGITKDNTVLANYPGQDAVDYTYHNDGSKYSNNSGSAYGATYTTNDVIGVAFDADNGTLTFYKNNSSQGQAYSGLTSGPYFPLVGDPSSTPDISATVNFGQRPFAYTAPSGFKALCDTSLPAPTIARPSTVFDTKLYTSNAGTLTVSGLGFSPDLAWLKSRGTGVAHALYDTVRGAGYALKSNTTEAEQYTTDGFVSFNSDGFTLGANVNSPQPDINYTNNVARVAWCWDAGSTTVTNTQGSITSSVRANASAGFSVITWSAQAAAGTVGHGLGVAPSLIIMKDRQSSGSSWLVFHSSVGAGKYLNLNTTSASTTLSTVFSTAPTSTVFDPGTVIISGNGYGNQVAYCFAPVAGLSSYGTYQGNGSADGPMVFANMRPRWIMLKRTDTTSNWTIIDTAREGYNVDNDPLYPNLADAEGTADLADILSNGFKLRSTDASVNASAGTYVYAAFAESPFAYSRAR